LARVLYDEVLTRLDSDRQFVTKPKYTPRSLIVPDDVAGQIRALRGIVAREDAVRLLPEEMADDSGLVEGAVRCVSVDAYERNPEARRRCIEHHGAKPDKLFVAASWSARSDEPVRHLSAG
jgi:hypothetical protein